MKGIVFTLLNDMVEEKLGLEVWDQVLNNIDSPSDGVYTTAGTYADEELFAIVAELHNISGTPIADLIKTFGEYCLAEFANGYSDFFTGHDAKGFLKSVEDVIHVEVRKLYPQAGLPTFEYEDPAANKLIMLYRSPRRLFDFAEGLILGTAKHYGITIDIEKDWPDGQDGNICKFSLTFS